MTNNEHKNLAGKIIYGTTDEIAKASEDVYQSLGSLFGIHMSEVDKHPFNNEQRARVVMDLITNNLAFVILKVLQRIDQTLIREITDEEIYDLMTIQAKDIATLLVRLTMKDDNEKEASDAIH